ncbi:uncharacterized protein LOC110372339 [Helicoverpa armigera]|uniref:uncharacterized protein LOC110372339 n=1 Tax=Helicoverpa armigera TaxID=29058 RepID=UPI00308293E0
MSDEDDFGIGGLYENGRWLWDERQKRIVFLSNLRPKVDEFDLYYTQPSGVMEFREDVDIIEQLRYRRYFQRKLEPGQADVIKLQDIKDLVIYTAPVNFLSAKLINMLHTPTGERFLRALILYCGYSIQIEDAMRERDLELEKKVRTPDSDILEEEYRDNLGDLRILVAKEYCTILTGAGDMKPFHHMGPLKKRRSLIEKDARSFETFIRMCVQIVYLSLGRRYFNQIELETHRLLKSEAFNAVGHKSQGRDPKKGHIQEVLLGKCLRHDRQLKLHSPLMNEVFCTRQIDYRLKGLGVVKYPNLTTRLKYLRLAVAGPEEQMATESVIIGIIGMPRARFDTMLRILPTLTPEQKSKSTVLMSRSKQVSSVTKSCTTKQSLHMRTYPDIIIPPKESVETTAPKGFPEDPDDINPVNEVQRRLWQSRFKMMMNLLTQRRKPRR